MRGRGREGGRVQKCRNVEWKNPSEKEEGGGRLESHRLVLVGARNLEAGRDLPLGGSGTALRPEDVGNARARRVELYVVVYAHPCRGEKKMEGAQPRYMLMLRLCPEEGGG